MNTNNVSSLNGIFKEVYADKLEDLIFMNLFGVKMENKQEFLDKYGLDAWAKLTYDEKIIVFKQGVVHWEKSIAFQKDIKDLLDK